MVFAKEAVEGIYICSVYIVHCRKIANNITNDKSLSAQHI